MTSHRYITYADDQRRRIAPHIEGGVRSDDTFNLRDVAMEKVLAALQKGA